MGSYKIPKRYRLYFCLEDCNSYNIFYHPYFILEYQDNKSKQPIKKAKKDIEDKNIELKKLSITDKLTNLYNRRKIEELLEIEINRSERFNHPFGLAIVDIDNFKDVNDTYGHQIGDKILIEISSILKNNLRKTDFVGRFGGEEFVIICPESDLESVSSLMETFRKKIANYDFTKIKNKTASFGVTISKKGDDIESILQRADIALYQAKNDGRNKVVVKDD